METDWLHGLRESCSLSRRTMLEVHFSLVRKAVYRMRKVEGEVKLTINRHPISRSVITVILQAIDIQILQ